MSEGMHSPRNRGEGQRERASMRMGAEEFAVGGGELHALESEQASPEVKALDEKIAGLNAQIAKGREVLAGITNPKVLEMAVTAAEKSETEIKAEIAELELQKLTLQGKKPS